MTELCTTIRGRRLAYWRMKRARHTGPTRLLLHGLAADHRGLLPLARQWPDADVIALDLPGFGHSEPLPGRHTLARYADTVESFCARLGLSEVVAIGHSLGATIALTLAARHPGRLHRLALLNPVTTGSGPGTWAPLAYFRIGSRLPDWAARLWFLSRPVVYLADSATLVSTDPGVRRRVLTEDYRTAAMASPRAVTEICRSVLRAPFAAIATGAHVPTLIVGSATDSLAGPAALAALDAALPSSELVMVPDAGHLWVAEEPAAAAHLIGAALP